MLQTATGFRDALREAGQAVAGSGVVRDIAGDTVAVFTTWGFAGFGILVLAAVVGRRANVRRIVVPVVLGGLAAVVAAALGLVVKHAVAEPRPCQLHPALAEWTTCPPAGNWSFPSNHAVFAGAFAVTVVVVARSVGRLWIASAAVFLALGIAGSRVVLGVHYWWDVVAGLALGAVVAAAALALITPAVREVVDGRGHRRRRLAATTR